ncbi:MAG: hypothetical protein LBJ14_02580 [Desulfarculales bacterium]|jgi:hypothetical protein|nr:hypothetical protein [Desulfarculales bacterium]
MPMIDINEVAVFIEEEIGPKFHFKRREKIDALTLDTIIKRKNPYLFKAKANNSAADFVRSVLEATVSSGEETAFGNFLEGFAIFVSEKSYGGRKSSAHGIDLEFEAEDIKYLVSIKSGPNWGNSSQLRQLVANFNTAKKILHTSGGAARQNIICVEGCCYGRDDKPDKGAHLKLCGQRFWEMISGGNESLYGDIIIPLGHAAKSHNEEITESITRKFNALTGEFINRFCHPSGEIDWERLIKFNSGKK